jgi:hypothetical protein
MTMPGKTLEDRVRLATARSELELIVNRYGLGSTDKKTYCFRPMWDARSVVSTLPESGSFRTRAGIIVGHREGLVATVGESANLRPGGPLEWSSATKSSVAYPLSRETGDSTDKTTARIDSMCPCNQTCFGSSVEKREAT